MENRMDATRRREEGNVSMSWLIDRQTLALQDARFPEGLFPDATTYNKIEKKYYRIIKNFYYILGNTTKT